MDIVSSIAIECACISWNAVHQRNMENYCKTRDELMPNESFSIFHNSVFVFWRFFGTTIRMFSVAVKSIFFVCFFNRIIFLVAPSRRRRQWSGNLRAFGLWMKLCLFYSDWLRSKGFFSRSEWWLSFNGRLKSTVNWDALWWLQGVRDASRIPFH